MRRTTRQIERTIREAKEENLCQEWYENRNDKVRARLINAILKMKALDEQFNTNKINRKVYQRELKDIIRRYTFQLNDYETFRFQYCLGKYIEKDLKHIDDLIIDEEHFRDLYEQTMRHELDTARADSNHHFTLYFILILMLSVSNIAKRLSNLEDAQ